MINDNTSTEADKVTTEDQLSPTQRAEILRALVGRNPGLGRSALPVLTRLSETGLMAGQLQEILDIPVNEADLQGRANKTKWFLNAIEQTYSPSYLASLSTNFSRYKSFLETIRDIEEVRAEIAAEKGDLRNTYLLCFEMAHQIGPERTRDLFLAVSDYLLQETKQEVNPVRALYTVKSLFEESQRMSCTPEALLEFRTRYFLRADPDDDSTDEEEE